MTDNQKAFRDKLQLLNQSLSAAASSVNLSKQLIKDLEKEAAKLAVSPRDLPGIIGKFDGFSMVTKEGEKYPVPENYAAKTRIVFGDTLKLINENGENRFKQIEKVPRRTVEGILAVKDGKFYVVTDGGSFKLLQSAVRFQNGKEGSKVKVILPQGSKHVTFAALDEVEGRVGEEKPEDRSSAKRGKSELSSEAKGQKQEERKQERQTDAKEKKAEGPESATVDRRAEGPVADPAEGLEPRRKERSRGERSRRVKDSPKPSETAGKVGRSGDEATVEDDEELR